MKFQAFENAHQDALKALLSKEKDMIKTTLQHLQKTLQGFRWTQFNEIDQRFTWKYLDELQDAITEHHTLLEDESFSSFLKETHQILGSFKNQSTLNPYTVYKHFLKTKTSAQENAPSLKKMAVYACGKAIQGHYEKAIFEQIFSELTGLKNADQTSIVLKIEKTSKLLHSESSKERQVFIEMQLLLARLYFITRAKKSKDEISQFESYEPIASFAFSESIRQFHNDNHNIEALIRWYGAQAQTLPQPLKLLWQDQLYYFLRKKLSAAELASHAKKCSSETKILLQEFAFMHPNSGHHDALVRFIALAFQDKNELSAHEFEKFLIQQPAFRPYKRLFNYNHISFSTFTLPLQRGIKPLSAHDLETLHKTSSTIPHLHVLFHKLDQKTSEESSVLAGTVDLDIQDVQKELTMCLEKSLTLYRRRWTLETIQLSCEKIETPNALHQEIQKLKRALQTAEQKKKCPQAWTFIDKAFSFLEHQGLSCASQRMLMAEFLKEDEKIESAVQMLTPYRTSAAVCLKIIELLYVTRDYPSIEYTLNYLMPHQEQQSNIEYWRKRIADDIQRREEKLADIIKIRKNQNASVDEMKQAVSMTKPLLSEFPLDQIFKARVLYEKLALEFTLFQTENNGYYTQTVYKNEVSIHIDLKNLENAAISIEIEVLPYHPKKEDPTYTLAEIYYFCAKAFHMGQVTNLMMSNSENKVQLGEIKKVQYDSAIIHLKEVLAYNKNHLSAKWLLAEAHAQLAGNYESIIDEHAELAKKHAETAESHSELIDLTSQKLAQEHTQLAQHHKNQAMYHIETATTYRKEALSHIAEAECMYQTLIQEKTAEEDALFKMFGLCFNKKRYDEAYSHIRDLIARFEGAQKNHMETYFKENISLTSLLYFAGCTAELLGKKTEARFYFKKTRTQYEKGPCFDVLLGQLNIFYCKNKKNINDVQPIKGDQGASIVIYQNEYYFRDYCIKKTQSIGDLIRIKSLKPLFARYMIPMLKEGSLKLHAFLRTTMLYQVLLEEVGSQSVYFKDLQEKFLSNLAQREKRCMSQQSQFNLFERSKVMQNAADNRTSLDAKENDEQNQSSHTSNTTV